MAKTTPASITPLHDQLEQLAAFEPVDLPVLSLYLDLTADQHGRDRYDQFVRKTLADRLKSLPARSPERESFERDATKIRDYLGTLDRSANGLALFACAGANDFFEAIQLDAPVDQHWLFIGAVPHIYPLARLVDQYPRYAAVVLDTNAARIFVFGLSRVERAREVTNEKTRRHQMGGWSQNRYQRHVDHLRIQHVKEVVDTLDQLVTAEQIAHIVIVGDEVVVPMVRQQLPKPLAEKVVDTIKLERGADEGTVLQVTLELLRTKDASTDAEIVEELITQWRSGGLGVAGPEATLRALTMGQVDQLVIAGTPASLKPVQTLPEGSAPGDLQVETSAPQGVADPERVKLADELVTRAEQTAARIRFIENTELLADVGGVGALLRFRI
jgi:peptide chain release factor subunit 1